MGPFSTVQELAARIPDGIPGSAEVRAAGLLDDASALIRAEAGKTWEDEVAPEICKTVCLGSAKRAFLNPEGVTSFAVDGNAAAFSTSSPDIYLTKAELRLVRHAAGRGGLWTQSTTRSEEGVGLDTPSVSDAASGAVGARLDFPPLDDIGP